MLLDKVGDLFGRSRSASALDEFPPVDEALEAELRRALQRQTADVEPRPDAYARLAEAAAAAPSTVPSFVRPLVSAAAACALLAGGVMAISRFETVTSEVTFGSQAENAALPTIAPSLGLDDADESSPALDEAEGPDVTPAPGGDKSLLSADKTGEELASSTVPLSQSSRVAAPIEPVSFGAETFIVGGGALGLWPEESSIGARAAGTTADRAVQNFLRLVGVSPAIVGADDDGDVVAVHAPDESEPNRRGTVLSEVAVSLMEDGTTIITEAMSDQIPQLTVTPRALADDDKIVESLTVSGLGMSLDEQIRVDLISATDGRLLERGSTTGGAQGDLARFTIDMAVAGVERAWVVAYATAADMSVAFSAVPVAFVGSRSQTVFTVVGLPADDPDGGLVVREAPGLRGKRIGVVPQGTTGIRRTDRAPVFVSPSAWWFIEAPDGTSGWVSSTYLASPGPLSNPQRLSVGNKIVDLFDANQSRSAELLARLPFSERVPIFTGTFDQPERARNGDDARAAIDASEVANTNPVASLQVDYPDAEVRQAAVALFGDLPVVVLRSPQSPEELFVYIDASAEEPFIVAVMTVIAKPEVEESE